MGNQLKTMLMVMNVLIRIDSIHDRKSIHHVLVSKLDDLIIVGGKKNKVHEISFALDQACR